MMDLNNDREHPVEKFFEEVFEAGWKSFINSMKDEHRKSNYRLLKVIDKVKGRAYLNSVKTIIKNVGADSLIRFSNEASGQVFTYPEWVSCGPVQIDQRSTAEGMVMEIYIPVKENKYLWIRKYQ
jgi:hypothetical protein